VTGFQLPDALRDLDNDSDGIDVEELLARIDG
jgi:hypothetical protein